MNLKTLHDDLPEVLQNTVHSYMSDRLVRRGLPDPQYELELKDNPTLEERLLEELPHHTPADRHRDSGALSTQNHDNLILLAIARSPDPLARAQIAFNDAENLGLSRDLTNAIYSCVWSLEGPMAGLRTHMYDYYKGFIVGTLDDKTAAPYSMMYLDINGFVRGRAQRNSPISTVPFPAEQFDNIFKRLVSGPEPYLTTRYRIESLPLVPDSARLFLDMLLGIHSNHLREIRPMGATQCRTLQNDSKTCPKTEVQIGAARFAGIYWPQQAGPWRIAAFDQKI